MSVFDTIAKPGDRPIICTISGEAGIGKTSLAATFPDPIFIRAEDGVQSIPSASRPDAFPVIESVDMLWEQLTALIEKDHKYKTLVIDSVSQLELMFSQHIVESDPKKPKSINQAMGGYGAGLQAVAALHQRVRKAAGILNERKNMHIVFIAHADTSTVELPDQDAYTRYDLRLGKRSVSPYLDNVDLVGFIKLETYTFGDGERKKATSTGNRLMVTYTTAANVSKNRYGITEDLPVAFGKNPLVPFVPMLGGES